MSKIFQGYCVLDKENNVLHFGSEEESLSLIKLVRDRDYPSELVGRWVQGINTPTVTQVIKERAE